MKKIANLTLILICCQISFSFIQINELLSNPIGSDLENMPNGEWIELLANDSINLTQFYLKDIDDNKLTLNKNNTIVTNISNSEYLITVFRNGHTRFTLNNNGDKIRLFQIKNKSVEVLIDEVEYFKIEEGLSLSKINNSFYETIPTKFTLNKIKMNSRYKIDYHNEIIFPVNKEIKNFFKIYNLNNYKIYDLFVTYNISKNNDLIKNDDFKISEINSYKTSGTGNHTFTETGNYTICGKLIRDKNNTNINNIKICQNIVVVNLSKKKCDAKIDIQSDDIFNENIKYKFKVEDSTYFNIKYNITDIFGNIIKSNQITNNQNFKTYSPKDKNQLFIINGELVTYCDDINHSNNLINKLVIVKGKKPESKSKISIDKIYTGYDNSVKFGEILKIKVKIYKGNTTKNQIKFKVVDSNDKQVSKVSYASVFNNFEEQIFSIPIILYNNCNEKLKNGKYYIIIEGLDRKIQQKIFLKDIVSSNCNIVNKIYHDNEPSKKPIKKWSNYNILLPDEIYENTYFNVTINITNKNSFRVNYSLTNYFEENSNYKFQTNFSLNGKETKLVILENYIEDFGDKKLNIVMNRSKYKTLKKWTYNIKVKRNKLIENIKSKILNNKIHLNISIKNIDKIIINDSGKTIIKRINENLNKIKMIINSSKYNNKIEIYAYNNNELIDSKILSIKNNNFENISSNNLFQSKFQEKEIKKERSISSNNINNKDESSNLITGNIIYESRTQKIRNKLSTIFSVVLIIIIIFILGHKK